MLKKNTKNIDNDQVLLTKYCNKNPDEFYIDTKAKFFAVVHNSFRDIDSHFEFKKETVYFNTHKPYFIHAPSGTLLNNIIIKLLVLNIKSNKSLYRSFNFSHNRQKYKLSDYIHEIFYVLKTGIAWRDIRSHINLFNL